MMNQKPDAGKAGSVIDSMEQILSFVDMLDSMGRLMDVFDPMTGRMVRADREYVERYYAWREASDAGCALAASWIERHGAGRHPAFFPPT